MYRLARTDSHAFDLSSYQIHAAYFITEAYRPSHTITKGQAERLAPALYHVGNYNEQMAVMMCGMAECT